MSLQDFIDESVAELTDTGLMPAITDETTDATMPQIRKQLRTHLALRFAQIASQYALDVDVRMSPVHNDPTQAADMVYEFASRLAEKFVPISEIELK